MKSTILLFLLFIVVIKLKAEETPVIQSNFEGQKDKWILAKYNGASATFSIDDLIRNQTRAVIKINKSTGKPKDLQLIRDIELAPNKTYSIYFTAITTNQQEIDLSFEDDFEIWWDQPVILEPTKQTYGPFTFNSKITSNFSYFCFNLGKVQDQILLDSIIVMEKSLIETFSSENKGLRINKSYYQNQLTIEFPEVVSQYGMLNLTDLRGRKVVSKILRPNQTEIILDALKEGIYVLQITINQKVLKEKIIFR